LETGVKVIDSLVPIGKGQRELILGDRKTGKTSLGIDAIIHQITSFKFNLKEKRNTSLVLCIYVAIGQRQSAIARIADLLEKKGCMSHTTVVSASAASPMGMQYIAPYSGVTIAEQ
jgi:F-type H+-transporting ATPase subunit alpha